ncbi:PKS-ER domain-containing protein [Mycena chlorophos]|uniref:PKS-ER domain-containing protein n=1 Tax=Mycena chlorophos TaxID=658473 RepID=A0A8H6TG59_MYCCL|nr:PKS-ER domain-containing protein [Mycena chlorophos]
MSLPTTMRAVVCPRAPIPPHELVYLTTHPTPKPQAGHVLIRVKGFGLNRSELYTRNGESLGFAAAMTFPRILGIEAVGIVEHAGGGSWKRGDVVAAMMGGMGRKFDGGYAEYTLVPHGFVSPPVVLPTNLTWAQFAAIPETFLAAWGTLKSSLKLQPSESLLIRGGSSSFGLALAALAKSTDPNFGFGAATVISTTRTESKTPVLKASGVDHVVIDPPSSQISETVRSLTNGAGVNKAVELVGPPVLVDTAAALKPDGVVSVVGSLSNVWNADLELLTMLMPAKSITMFASYQLVLSETPLQAIVDAVARGDLKLNVDKVFNISETGEAHAYMEANRAAGKVVCLVD